MSTPPVCGLKSLQNIYTVNFAAARQNFGRHCKNPALGVNMYVHSAAVCCLTWPYPEGLDLALDRNGALETCSRLLGFVYDLDRALAGPTGQFVLRAVVVALQELR